jgi:hypothetical protein
MRAASSRSYGYAPPIPPRSPPTSPLSSHARSTSPRRVVEDFATFGAPKTSSVFGTAVASSPFSLAGNKAAFGSVRNGGSRGISMDDDDEDDDDMKDGKQRVVLREDSITFDQVCYLLLSLQNMFSQFLQQFIGSSDRHAECMERHACIIFIKSLHLFFRFPP